jgi:hypothetical protein
MLRFRRIENWVFEMIDFMVISTLREMTLIFKFAHSQIFKLVLLFTQKLCLIRKGYFDFT